jgi:hypothetical protein
MLAWRPNGIDLQARSTSGAPIIAKTNSIETRLVLLCVIGVLSSHCASCPLRGGEKQGRASTKAHVCDVLPIMAPPPLSASAKRRLRRVRTCKSYCVTAHPNSHQHCAIPLKVCIDKHSAPSYLSSLISTPCHTHAHQRSRPHNEISSATSRS